MIYQLSLQHAEDEILLPVVKLQLHVTTPGHP